MTMRVTFGSAPNQRSRAPKFRARPGTSNHSFRESASPGVLALLDRPEVNLVSWRRSLPPGVDAGLKAWAEGCPAEFDGIVSAPHWELAGALRGLEAASQGWMERDVHELLERFAALADARRVRVSFGVIRGNRCTKFHVDYVRYRLITTYTGPGTEWLPESALRREALDHPADCPCDANRDIVRDERAVRHAVPGEVSVMKGARHEHARGAVHRSPPIEGTGRIRVVLIASTVDGH